MRIRNPGKICDHLWYLGNEASCVYLLEGSRESILINGGVSFVVPDIISQFREYGIDESKITRILLLHSHFDHVGIAPFFKRRNPKITILASSRAWKALTKPKVLDSINEASQYVIKNRDRIEVCSAHELDWTVEITGESVGEGDKIDLGDMNIVIDEIPGHSPCSISGYVPKLKILFPSDAGGLPLGEKIVTYGTSNYSDFEKSILKLKNLPVSYICSDHYGYVAGDETGTFIEKSIQAAKERRIIMENLYRKTGNVDEAAQELAFRFKDENVLELVPDDVFLEAHRQMVLHVAGKRN